MKIYPHKWIGVQLQQSTLVYKQRILAEEKKKKSRSKKILLRGISTGKI